MSEATYKLLEQDQKLFDNLYTQELKDVYISNLDKTIKMFTVEQIKFDSESNSSAGQQFVDEDSQVGLGGQAEQTPINVNEQNEEFDSYYIDSGKNNHTYDK